MTEQVEITAMQEQKMSTDKERAYRASLEDYFAGSMGTNVDRLKNFSKYVPRQLLTRFISRYELFKKVLHVNGSIAECGVFMGGGLMSWAQISSILEPVNWTRQIIGFDTFEGFPSLSEKDTRTSESQFAHVGGLAMNSYDDLQAAIQLYDQNRNLGHLPKVRLVKGDATQTIPAYISENPHTVISLLYLDFDIYEPTKVALEHFLPRMPKGAIVAFDELNSPNWPGETEAVMEVIGLRNLRLQRFEFDTLISYAVLE